MQTLFWNTDDIDKPEAKYNRDSSGRFADKKTAQIARLERERDYYRSKCRRLELNYNYLLDQFRLIEMKANDTKKQ